MSGSSEFDRLRALWDDHARVDPLWAVLALDDKRDRSWDLRDFMKQGEREIALLMHRCEELGLAVSMDSALDFGCGVGRLTQALGRRFRHTVGLDISPEMIRLAQGLNKYPGKVTYRENRVGGLAEFDAGSFDLIYSSIVLQHVPPPLTLEYLRQFVRLLRPNGLVIFQLPAHRLEHRDVETRPMARAAYQAQVEIGSSAPSILAAGETAKLSVRVRNISPEPWVQADVGSLRVGNHWFDTAGSLMIVQDDGRSGMPQVVPPGGSFEVELAVNPPIAGGSLWLEVDVVHEGVSWFSSMGSTPARRAFTVSDRASASPPPLMLAESAVPDYPQSDLELVPAEAHRGTPEPFPMYAVERDVVIECLSAGADVVEVEHDPRAGHEWQSYRYFARKR